MPHDKNGNLIESGDGVVFADWPGAQRVGVVTNVSAISSTCNVTVATPIVGGCEHLTINADMCEVLTRNGARVSWPVPVTEQAAVVPTPAPGD